MMQRGFILMEFIGTIKSGNVMISKTRNGYWGNLEIAKNFMSHLAGLLHLPLIKDKPCNKMYLRKLCLKLENYNIRGELLNWIKNYPSNRTQKVIVEVNISDSIVGISGVPKGTVWNLYFFSYTCFAWFN